MPGSIEPDLSSLVSTAKGWEAPKLPPVGAPPASTSNPNAPTLYPGGAPGSSLSASSGGNGHAGLATGSNKSPSPFLPGIHAEEERTPAPVFGARERRESSAVMRLVEASEPIFDASMSFGAGVVPPRGRKKISTGTIIGIAAAVVFVGAVLAVWIASSGDKGPDAKSASAGNGTAAAEKGRAAAPRPIRRRASRARPPAPDRPDPEPPATSPPRAPARAPARRQAPGAPRRPSTPPAPASSCT
jgi:hypothetical protein